jgi:GxxExxY protein
MEITKSYLKNLVYQVNGAAIEVHKALGPGLLESVYHKCLMHELGLRGIKCESEVRVNVEYKGLLLDTTLRCDILVEGILVIELKAVDVILPIHEAQILTYMNLLQAPEGVIFNFNVVNLYKDGQKTYVNELYRDLPE